MNKTLKGYLWTALDKVSLQLVNFVVFLILARLLDPKDFGLAALSAVFVAFFQLFVDQGMAQAIVQFEKIDSRHLNTAFWVSMVTGVVCAVLGILLSGSAAMFFRESGLQPIIIWLSLTFIFSALSSTQQAILQRNLEFKKLALRSIVAKVFSGVIGIGMALYGAGVWSLVGQTLAYSIAEAVMLWSVSAWRPSFDFSVLYMKRFIQFSVHTTGVRLMEFFDGRFDDFVIGYFLGTTALGYYTIAFRVLRMLLDFLAVLPGGVLFPTLARLQHDPAEFKKVFNAFTGYAVILIWPAFLGAFVTAEELLVVFFGEQWHASVPVFQLLALGGVLFATFQINGAVLWALGHTRLILRNRFILTFLRVAAYLIAVQFGIAQVAGAYLFVALFVLTPIYLNILRRFLNFNIKELIDLYWMPVAASGLMAAALWAGKTFFLYQAESVFLRFVILAVCGAIIYFAVIFILMPDLFGNLKLLINDLQRRAV